MYTASAVLEQLRLIENTTKRKIQRMPVPSMTEAIAGQQRLTVEDLMRQIEAGKLEHYKSIAAELLQLSFRRLLDFLPALFTKPDVGSIGILDRSYTGKSYPPAVRLNRVL